MTMISVSEWERLANGWDFENERQNRLNEIFALMESAIQSDDWKSLSRLIRSGASPQMSIGGRTPLHIAAASNSVNCASLLLETGASPSPSDARGICPLMMSIEGMNREMFDLLLSKGASENRMDKTRRTPLIVSAIAGFYHSAKALVDVRVNLNARDSSGRTALHYVLAKREPTGDDIAIARLLLNEKANPNQRDLQGRRPVDNVGHDSFLSALEAAEIEAQISSPEPAMEDGAPQPDIPAPSTPDDSFGVVRRRRPRL